MRIFQNTSLRRKQTLIIMLTSGVVLLLACAAFSIYEVITFRKVMVQHLSTLAEIVGNNTSAALDFNESKSAVEILSALQAEPGIMGACIYRKSGEAFANYDRANDDITFTPPALYTEGHTFERQRLILSRPIAYRGETIGVVYLESDMRALSSRLARYAGIVGLVFLASLLLAFMLSNQLQRLVSDPILHLVQVARSVALEKNYSVRATKQSNDELGQLVDGFNEMLVQIQARDTALQTARDHLEKRVEDRTQSLQLEIRERKDAEAALRDSDEKFRQLAENITDVFWIRSPDLHDVHYVSPAYEQTWGRSTESLYANPQQWSDDILPEDRERVQAAFATLTGAASSLSIEYRIVRPDGEVRWVHARGFQVRDATDELIRLTGIITDITERKRAENALLESEARNNAIVQSALDCIVMIDHEGKILEFNPAAEKVFGYARAGVLGQELAEVIIPASLRAQHRQGMMRFLATGQSKILGQRLELTAIRSDGSEFPIELAVTRLGAERPPTFTGFIRDISDRKRADEKLEKAHKQLLETSRRAGMAEVATSVLHNVGNVLNSVNVASSCLADSLRRSKSANLSKVVTMLREHEGDVGTFLTSDPKGKQLPGYLAQLAEHLAGEQAAALKELAGLQKNIDHIKDIVAMQQSYGQVSGVMETMKISDLVDDALRMNAGALTRHEIQVIREYGELPPVTTDKHKVLQVLVNLIRNAKYACNESGRADKRLTVQVANGEGRVKISVVDNGIGIPAENLTRIFNHGFTTRKDGHGFGLHSGALAAKELGGSLTVHSDGLGQGAAFTLELPCPTRENSHE